MITRPSTWAEVQVGTYLQGERGETWKVIDERAGWVLLESRAGSQVPLLRPVPGRHVSILEPTMEEGIAVAAHVLGAVVIPEQGVTGGPVLSRFPGRQEGHRAG